MAAAVAVRTRRATLTRSLAPYLLILPGGVWLFLLFVLPMATLAITSLETGDFSSGFQFSGNVSNYTFGVQTYPEQFLHALEYGVASTLLALVIAYPVAYWIAFHGGSRKSAYLLIVLLPFFVSFVIRTLSWQLLLNDDGPLFGALKNIHVIPSDFHVLATPVAVVGGLTYTFFPYMLLPIYASLEKVDRRLLEAAGDLFANKAAVFRRVVLPLSAPGVFAGILLTGIPTTADYVNQDLLGGVNTTMIGRVIQQQFEFDANYPLAAALAFIFMIGLLVTMLLYARVFGTEELVGG